MQLKWPMRWDLFSLFPAYAGVIPPVVEITSRAKTFPRIRGGDPEKTFIGQNPGDFSPHTRG